MEVEIELPHLDRTAMSRIVDWICGNQLAQINAASTDAELMKM